MNNLKNTQMLYQVFSFVKMIQTEIEKRETLRRYTAIFLSGLISYSIYTLAASHVGSDSYVLVFLSAFTTLSLFYIYDTVTAGWRLLRASKKFEKEFSKLQDSREKRDQQTNKEPVFVGNIEDDKDINLH